MPDLTYAATSRCLCGAGMAYKKDDDCWDCSAILLGTADATVKHEDRLPFRFWSVKPEGHWRFPGMTTRPETN